MLKFFQQKCQNLTTVRELNKVMQNIIMQATTLVPITLVTRQVKAQIQAQPSHNISTHLSVLKHN